MPGIDAKVVLGLAGKMSEVFADDDTYQSFPLAPIGLKADSLRQMVAEPLGAGAHAHAQFSLLVNEIPDGSLWQPGGDRWLWDVYGEVLTTAELLDGQATPEQQAAYEKAFALLYRVGEDGTTRPSATVVAYERHRDAYLAASMEYNNRKGEAEVSSDPAVKEAWPQDEPRLRAAVEAAGAAWSAKGDRDAVEDARRVINELGSNSPQAVWAGFMRLFDPSLREIFFRTSQDGVTYVPTTYLPSDVADVEWSRITVDAEALRQYAERAPVELRERLGEGADSGIDRVSFEYSYVTVLRGWFTPQVFASRAWQFPNPDHVLSDGAVPPTGECTAYVTGLVLARSITVHRKKEGSTQKEPDVDLSEVNLGFLPANLVDMRLRSSVVGVSADAEEEQLPSAVVLDDPTIWGTMKVAERVSGRVVVRDHREETRDRPTQTRDHRSKTSDHRTKTRNHRTDEGASEDLSKTVVVDDFFPSVRETIKVRAARSEQDSASEGEKTVTNPDDVFVLSMHCRLLPKSPDPRITEEFPKPQPEQARTHVVEEGDTLAKIAEEVYGSKDMWRKIYEANRKSIGKDPGLIRPGQRLRIP